MRRIVITRGVRRVLIVICASTFVVVVFDAVFSFPRQEVMLSESLSADSKFVARCELISGFGGSRIMLSVRGVSSGDRVLLMTMSPQLSIDVRWLGPLALNVNISGVANNERDPIVRVSDECVVDGNRIDVTVKADLSTQCH